MHSNRFKNRQVYTGMFIGVLVSMFLVFLIQYNRWLVNKTLISILVIILCAFIGSILGFLFQSVQKPMQDDGVLHLRREKLRILKRMVKSGDVTVRKEVIHESRNITVPVTREDLVIENNKTDPSNGKRLKETIIRIPYKEERISIEKKAVQLEDVSIFKRQLVKSHQIRENLREEKAHINVSGNCIVRDENNKEV